jgi:hypothetical protein
MTSFLPEVMKRLSAILLQLFLCADVLCASSSPSLHPPAHFGPPRLEHATTNRDFTGMPSLAIAPKGRIWATWHAGVTPAEDLNC